MKSAAHVGDHPIHPMLVPIPIGLWIFSFVADLFHVGGSANAAWPTVAFYCMGAGIVGALAAALPGLIDLLSLPAGPRSTAIKHMSINLTVVVLYVINFYGFTMIFPWFVAERNLGTVAMHLIFGAVLGATYAWLAPRDTHAAH